MKLLFTFLVISFTFYNVHAQVKAFAPLSCFTWGPDQFLDFETVQGLGSLIQYHFTDVPYNASSYEAFGKDRGVYSWTPDDKQYSYINNIQVIRWKFVDESKACNFIVKDLYDNEVYSTSSKNSCGVIIFPDSIMNETEMNIVMLQIKPVNYQDQLNSINFSSVMLRNSKYKDTRLAILKELQSCNTIECKIEKLKAHKAILDILSLLELEKMKDPKNKAIDKLYWEIVSQIRYGYSNRVWER